MVDIKELADGVIRGEKRSLARAITVVENNPGGTRELLGYIYPHTGGAYIIGVTGSPGVGKSTLVYSLARYYRSLGKKVGVLAVDPTSPFTGGAILGDRIRMSGGEIDQGLYIRSLASRGHLGGLSEAASDALALIDAAGYEIILLETVGTGQAEVEVMRFAHTVLVTLVPGLGDEIQAIKAGILEIGDVFVVNKADRDGMDKTVLEIEMMLDLAPLVSYRPRVIRTVASKDEGIEELVKEIERHKEHLIASDALNQKQMYMAEERVKDILIRRVSAYVLDRAGTDLDIAMQDIASRKKDPYTAAEEILKDWFEEA